VRIAKPAQTAHRGEGGRGTAKVKGDDDDDDDDGEAFRPVVSSPASVSAAVNAGRDSQSFSSVIL
jgi:hypothetical protein